MEAPLLLAHGFKPKLVDRLVEAGLASKRTEWMRGRVTPIYLVWIEITDAGRAALRR
jgi:hypothetical protein